MNLTEAHNARRERKPVVYTETGELGTLDRIDNDERAAFVLYLGDRLAKYTRLDQLMVVESIDLDIGGGGLIRAGKVHGGKDA